jgi:tRNA A-37 threonylcarbamoyl transferase component Bud32
LQYAVEVGVELFTALGFLGTRVMESTLDLSELKFEGVTLSMDKAAALPRPLKVAWILRSGFLSSMSRVYATVFGRAIEGPGKPLVVVKCYSRASLRDAEVDCYRALKSMQGRKIPVLLDADFSLPDLFVRKLGKSFKFALVLSFVSYNYGRLTAARGDYMEACREIVREMHLLGVAHGDPRGENVLVNRSTGETIVIDFTKGSTLAKVGKKRFQKACEKDMTVIDDYNAAFIVAWGDKYPKRPRVE